MHGLRARSTSTIALCVLTLALTAAPAGAQSGMLTLSAASGPRGSTITVTSTSPCNLPQGVSGSPFVRLTLSQGSTIVARQDVPVSPPGVWSGVLTVGAKATPGTATIGGDCIASPQAEGSLLHYQDVTFTVTASPPTTTSTSVTTTTSPSSGTATSTTWLVVLAVAVVVLALLLAANARRRRRSSSTSGDRGT